MHDEVPDLLDHRARLVRLALAVTIGAVLALIGMLVVRRLAVAPTENPMSQMSAVMMSVGMLVACSCLAHAVLARIAQRGRNQM